MKGYIVNNGKILQNTNLPMPKLEADTHVLIKNEYAGINYDDYRIIKNSENTQENIPLGLEGAGVIAEAGSKSGFQKGQRVAYFHRTLGAFSEYTVADALNLVAIPDNISSLECASMLRRAVISYILLKYSCLITTKQTILIHGASGGVGHILSKMGKYFETTVIGTVSRPEKKRFAAQSGCDLVIDRSSENFKEKVQEFTKGEGVDVVFDGIGQPVFKDSLEILKPTRTYVSFGNVCGEIENFNIALCATKSLFFTCPRIQNYITHRNVNILFSNNVFNFFEKGVFVPHYTKYEFNDLPDVLEDMKKGVLTGSLTLKISI